MTRIAVAVVLAAVTLAAVTLAGCQEAPIGPPPVPHPAPYAPPPPPPPPPLAPDSFRESDFAWSMATGPDRILGQMAYRGGGHRYTCHDVRLAPDTPWSRARMQILYLSDVQAAVPADEARARTPTEHGAQYGRYVRETPCDATGHFVFAGLPNGVWYVITAATPAGGGPATALMRRVETAGGTVIISLH